jgi:hypothetical protein
VHALEPVTNELHSLIHDVGVLPGHLGHLQSESPSSLFVSPIRPEKLVTHPPGSYRKPPNPSLKRSPNSRPRYSASRLSLPRGLLLGPG